jgi:hypothetical protein
MGDACGRRERSTGPATTRERIQARPAHRTPPSLAGPPGTNTGATPAVPTRARAGPDRAGSSHTQRIPLSIMGAILTHAARRCNPRCEDSKSRTVADTGRGGGRFPHTGRDGPAPQPVSHLHPAPGPALDFRAPAGPMRAAPTTGGAPSRRHAPAIGSGPAPKGADSPCPASRSSREARVAWSGTRGDSAGRLHPRPLAIAELLRCRIRSQTGRMFERREPPGLDPSHAAEAPKWRPSRGGICVVPQGRWCR